MPEPVKLGYRDRRSARPLSDRRVERLIVGFATATVVLACGTTVLVFAYTYKLEVAAVAGGSVLIAMGVFGGPVQKYPILSAGVVVLWAWYGYLVVILLLNTLQFGSFDLHLGTFELLLLAPVPSLVTTTLLLAWRSATLCRDDGRRLT